MVIFASWLWEINNKNDQYAIFLNEMPAIYCNIKSHIYANSYILSETFFLSLHFTFSAKTICCSNITQVTIAATLEWELGQFLFLFLTDQTWAWLKKNKEFPGELRQHRKVKNLLLSNSKRSQWTPAKAVQIVFAKFYVLSQATSRSPVTFNSLAR